MNFLYAFYIRKRRSLVDDNSSFFDGAAQAISVEVTREHSQEKFSSHLNFTRKSLKAFFFFYLFNPLIIAAHVHANTS